MGCGEFTTDYLTWIDGKAGFEVVPLSGIESWEQVDPKRWRFKLRQGVKFHNGEPWNAEAAKLGIDWNGEGVNPGTGFSYTGPTKGEVVDEYTADVVCGRPCPIFPRTAVFTKFQAPKWWASATEGEKTSMTMGFGPYRITGYRRGVDTTFEIYEGYLPNKAFDSQAPTIKQFTHVYRAENLVRAAMSATGEADWAADIGFESKGRVPQYKQSGTTEIYTLVLDTMWHPELKKQKVRLALAHAIDCQGLLDSLFQGQVKCHAAIAPRASVGITAENSKPRAYDPDLAKRLLKEAGYDPKNEINVNSRPGSNVRGLEILEAVVSYWRAAGVTSKLNSWGDLAKARDVQLSGCGQFGQDAVFKEKLDCAQRSPPGPYFASSHAYEVATSDEILDMQRQGTARMSCFGRSSRVCYTELQKKIDIASGTPPGPERTRLMEEVANIGYQEVYFIPFFEVQYAYGLSKDVVWEPYYAPRLRGNSMKWAK
jgi:peptide/nickel transport system substrate-binding protein